jgi:outer membrane lipoprotein
MRAHRYCWYWVCLAMLAGCAGTPPLNTQGVDRSFKSTDALTQQQTGIGKRVLWGGVIVRSENLPQSTELEVLGYSQDRSHRPDTESAPQNRFLIAQPGYLETKDYAPGRTVTVVGTLQQIRDGKVDRFAYQFPVVAAEQLHLWPRSRERSAPGVNFGFGVGFGL